jgi:hypothetical protein
VFPVWLASGGLVVSALDSEGATVATDDVDGDGVVSGDVLTLVVSVLLVLGGVLPLLPQPAAMPMVARAPQRVIRALGPLC